MASFSRLFLPFALALFFCGSATAHVWTDLNGNKVNARFIGFNKHTGQVILMAAGQRRIVVNYYQLVERDREYVRSKLAEKGRLSELVQFERQSRKAGKTSGEGGSGKQSSQSESASKEPAGDDSPEQPPGRPISSPRSLWILANGRTLHARAIELRGDQVVMIDLAGRRGTIPLSQFLPPDQDYLRRAASGSGGPAPSTTAVSRGGFRNSAPARSGGEFDAPPAVPAEEFANAMGPGGPRMTAPHRNLTPPMPHAPTMTDMSSDLVDRQRERARRIAEAIATGRTEEIDEGSAAPAEPRAPEPDGGWPEVEQEQLAEPEAPSLPDPQINVDMDAANRAIMELVGEKLVCPTCKSTFSSREYKVGDPCPNCSRTTTFKRLRAIKGIFYLVLLLGGGIAALFRRMTG